MRTNRWLVTAVSALAVLAVSIPAQAADVEQLLQQAQRSAQQSMAVVTYSIDVGGGQTAFVSGQAICVDASGVFVTLAANPAVRAEQMKDVKLILPGREPGQVEAESLGVEPSSGLGFFRAKGQGEWKPLEFKQTDFTVGQPVVSVGLLSAETGHAAYYGVGYVSTQVELPEKLVRVTGGTLTSPGSPVFNAQGQAIGIVGARQLPEPFVINERESVQLRSQQDTTYFLPFEEFAYALENRPQPGKQARLPWTGIMNFQPLPVDNLHTSLPAVQIGRVVPQEPAERAGVRNGDIVVGINGQPLRRMATPELTMANFIRQILRMKPDQQLTLTVLRGETTEDKVLTLAQMPVLPQEAKQLISPELGLAVRDIVMLDKYLDQDLPDIAGVLVFEAPQELPAGQLGLRAGEIITSVNGQPVSSVEAMRDVLQRAVPTEAVMLTVYRGGRGELLRVPPRQLAPAPR